MYKKERKYTGSSVSGRNGFSLFEVILAVGIFAGLVVLVANFRTNINALQVLLNQKMQSRQDVDQTLQMITTEMRSAGPSALGGYSIESAGTSSLTFYTDASKDGLMDRVRYFMGTSTLQRGVTIPSGNPLAYVTSTEATTTVVNNVIMPTSTGVFSYYDADYTGTSSPMASPVDVTKIRMIKVSLYMDIATSTAPKAAYSSRVIDVRNLRSN